MKKENEFLTSLARHLGWYEACNSLNHSLCTRVITFSFEYLLLLCSVRPFVRSSSRAFQLSEQAANRPAENLQFQNHLRLNGRFYFCYYYYHCHFGIERIKLWPFFDIISFVNGRKSIENKWNGVRLPVLWFIALKLSFAFLLIHIDYRNRLNLLKADRLKSFPKLH